ncbi:MAG TPA: SpaA isopeptide-forming pilin-related protein, partial [Erysipelothrix sp.]
MKKILQILFAMTMLLTSLPVQTLEAQSYNTMNENELVEAKNLVNYNILLSGNHSANQADVEGPLAVAKNSNFGKDTSEFSYGAIFNRDANTVGLAPTDTEDISLLLGGKVNRIGGGNYELTMDYYKDKGKVKGRFVAHDASISESKAAFKENLKSEQIYSANTDDIFNNLLSQNEKLLRKLNRYTNSSSKLLGETLGETWLDGRLVTYDMYQSDVDDNTILINILPSEQDKSLETIVHSFGIPQEFSDRNVIVTSFIRNQQGDRVHSDKVAFKGNFLSDRNGSINVADDEDRKAMAGKITYYFPQATQVTNFFNQVDYRTFINPVNISPDDQGVDEEGNFQYHQEYLSNYATGNNNNGSAASGGGAEIIGSVLAPQATIILTGSAINGFVSAKNLHQRNGAEIHNFRPTWIFEKEETLKTLLMKKVDTEGKMINDEKALFVLFRQAQGTKQYYKLEDNEVKWVTSEKAEKKSIDGGIAKFVNLKPGTYYIEERVAPEGYEKAEPLKVVIKEDAPEVVEVSYVNQKEEEMVHHNLSFRKVEKEGDELGLEGAEFVLVKKINDIPYYYVQFNDFVSWLPNVMFAKRFITTTDNTVIKNLEEGCYELWELKAPSGHVIEENKHIIEITLDQDISLDITNPSIKPWDKQKGPKGEISIKKFELGEDINQGLQGAEFILKGIGKNGEEKYLSTYSEKEILWDENRDEAYRFITDVNGALKINNLNLGRYVLEEVVPPEGYEIIDKEFEIELYQELSEQTVHYHFNIPNEKKVGSLQIEKVEKDREAHKLSGAEFYLYKFVEGEKHYFTNDKNIFSPDEDKAYIATTSIQGLAKIEGIPYGEYFLHEKKAPNGFKPIEQQDLKFNISKEHKVAYLTVENERKPWPELLDYGRLEIDKRAGEEVKIKLSGAQFVLQHEEHGFFTGADSLFDKNIENAKVVVTDEQGQAAFNRVPIGQYQLKEIQAPEGYQPLLEPIPVEIKSQEAGHVSFIHIKNYKTIPLANLEILKVDNEDNAIHLQGAEFILSKEGLYYAGPHQDFTENKADAL